MFFNRGTAHVHLLVWLKHLDELNINVLKNVHLELIRLQVKTLFKLAPKLHNWKTVSSSLQEDFLSCVPADDVTQINIRDDVTSWDRCAMVSKPGPPPGHGWGWWYPRLPDDVVIHPGQFIAPLVPVHVVGVASYPNRFSDCPFLPDIFSC